MPEPTHRLTDERLCWLAVRDHLDRKSRRLGVAGWVNILLGGRARGGTRAAGELRRSQRVDMMGDYGFAVSDAAQQLTAEERTRLRERGEVPDWFLADVERRYAEIRKGG